MSPSEMASSLNQENGHHSDQSDTEDVSMLDQDHEDAHSDDNLSDDLEHADDTSMESSYCNNGRFNDADLANGNSTDLQVTS